MNKQTEMNLLLLLTHNVELYNIPDYTILLFFVKNNLIRLK